MNTKILFLLIGLFLLSYSCQEPTPELSLIDQNILKYVNKNFHDPESYEYVSLELVDTIYREQELVEEIYKATIACIKPQVTYNSMKQTIKDYKRLNVKLKETDTLGMANYKIQMAKCKKEELALKQERDSILNSPNSKLISGFLYKHMSRARVPTGGLLLREASIKTDTNFNIKKWEE